MAAFFVAATLILFWFRCDLGHNISVIFITDH